jgi:hypothetical protein
MWNIIIIIIITDENVFQLQLVQLFSPESQTQATLQTATCNISEVKKYSDITCTLLSASVPLSRMSGAAHWPAIARRWRNDQRLHWMDQVDQVGGKVIPLYLQCYVMIVSVIDLLDVVILDRCIHVACSMSLCPLDRTQWFPHVSTRKLYWQSPGHVARDCSNWVAGSQHHVRIVFVS